MEPKTKIMTKLKTKKTTRWLCCVQ